MSEAALHAARWYKEAGLAAEQVGGPAPMRGGRILLGIVGGHRRASHTVFLPFPARRPLLDDSAVMCLTLFGMHACIVLVLMRPLWMSPQALEAAALVSSRQLEEHLLLTRLATAQLDGASGGGEDGPGGSAQPGDVNRGRGTERHAAAGGSLELQQRLVVSEARERSDQARADMAVHEQLRAEALSRAEDAVRRLAAVGEAAAPRARARFGIEAALRLRQSASEATERLAEAQRGLLGVQQQAEQAEARAAEQEGAAVAVQAASPYRPSLASPSGRQPVSPRATLPPTLSPYKPSLVQRTTLDSPRSPPTAAAVAAPAVTDCVGEVLELGRRYCIAAGALRNRIRDVLQPDLAALSREAEGILWEAAVAVHRARSLVAHSNILGIGGGGGGGNVAAADAAGVGAAGHNSLQTPAWGSVGQGPPGGSPSAGPFRQAQAMAACHVLDSELAAAALQLRWVHPPLLAGGPRLLPWRMYLCVRGIRDMCPLSSWYSYVVGNG